MSIDSRPGRTGRAEAPVRLAVRSSVRDAARFVAHLRAQRTRSWRASGSPQTGGSDPQSWRRMPPLLRLRVAPPCLRLQSLQSARPGRDQEFEQR